MAFDLLAIQDGALLAWGRPRGGLELELLDGSGRAGGAPIEVKLSPGNPIIEIAGASLGGRVGLAWLSRSASGAATFGVIGDAETRSFSEAFALSEVSVGDPTRRGHVAFAVSDKHRMVALTRGMDEPCDDEKQCATFRFRELLSTGPELRGLPASVPSPCPSPLAGFELVGERSHYAYCSRASSRSEVTAFMRQPDPLYVGLSKPAPGCDPLGSLRVGSDALFVLECAEGRRGMRIGGLGDRERNVDLTSPKLECVLGRPRLSAPGSPPFEMNLGDALGNLGAVLPAAFGVPGSRAAWTGTSLLVASWMRGNVILRRYECRGADLVRTG